MGYSHGRDDRPLEAARRIAGRGVQIAWAREAEMAFLRQQLVVLNRPSRTKARLLLESSQASPPSSIVSFHNGTANFTDSIVSFLLSQRDLCLPIMPSERSADGDRRAK